MGPHKLVNLLINTSEWEKVKYHIREFTSHTNIFLTVNTMHKWHGNSKWPEARENTSTLDLPE